MAVEVKIPEVGESITEGVLVEWSQADGAVVAAEDPLLVLETDKITMNVNAEQGGRLKILVPAGETVEVGQVVATIDPSAAGEAQTAAEPTERAEPAAAAKESEQAAAGAEAEPPSRSTPEELDGLSPAVQRMVREHGVDPSQIDGTGKGGRILKGDVIRFLEERRAQGGAEPPAKRSAPAEKEEEATVEPPKPAPPAPAAAPGERQTRAPMSRLRQRLAERLVEVQQSAAILTTFNEADMSRVMALRAAHKEDFKKRYGIGLGFMSFFVKAAVDALKTVPEVNAFIEGGEIVNNHYYDIGVAVSTDKGLVVPVVRDADRLSMAEIEASIADLATRAQERRLELSDLTGAVFTISNGGVFGSLLSTPILNPPGSAILGMHSIQKRPVVVDDEIVVRPMMYLAVSYDHRIIDGREAVTFLKRIKECLENPERMLLEV
ncbi:MAG TPA: 2-oxoglutarate dehydrogenase complex dihydrolipoyllysine-residue succinyltransferase [Chondromyces sp.]|nr:2-oxoglutarate dehydrogenase complex dihydrolipoyllysine-residue succinyltransferase [Chondromyces sp.]